MSRSAEESEYARAAELAYQELLSRMGEGEPQPRLEPTRRVVELLGDVHRAYPVIHIAGTNGKTSTARLIESILRALGLRTGLFTSPHLISLNERIQIDGEPIADETLVANWVDIKPYVEMVDAELVAKGELRLTFFEVITILGFASFADAPVDVAVVEAGMGGEWDATNVADGVVAVFTPIALDHTERLGPDINTIARTKSGIIKPAAMVVSAPQEPEGEAVLREAAALTESAINVLGTGGTSVVSEVAVGGQLVSSIGLAGTYDDLFVRLLGDHQAINAAVALMAVESFLGGASQTIDRNLLAEAFATVTSPGRLQRVASNPPVIVDAAHNPHGAQSLAEALTSYFDFDDITLVFGSLADKDYVEFVSTLAPFVRRIILTTPPSDRAIDAGDIAAALSLPPDVLVIVQPDPVVALVEARAYAAQSPKGAVVVSGSISLVGLTLACAIEEKWS
jgi:dihydrofolate synthase/folylpolyglutamate synthase